MNSELCIFTWIWIFFGILTKSTIPGPTTCGKPEQPPNSTLISTDFAVGNRIQYSCDEGHLLVGPTQRTCLPTGFYSEFPPVCRCKHSRVIIFFWDFTHLLHSIMYYEIICLNIYGFTSQNLYNCQKSLNASNYSE